MRVLVSGSRDWVDEDAVHRALDKEYRRHKRKKSPEPFVVVHGAAKGADTHAQNWAVKHGVQHEPHPAEWKKFHRAAGPIRNQAMVDSGADKVLAFPNPGSRGTADLMRRATKAGLPVVVHSPRPSKFGGLPGRS